MASREKQKQQPIKREFLPQKITYADICEDGSPVCKTRKVEKASNATSVSTAVKEVLKPFRMTFNPAEWEDTPPLRKPKSKITKGRGNRGINSVKKTLVPTKVRLSRGNCKYVPEPTFVKRKKKASEPIKTVRKELFGVSKKKASRNPLQQIPLVQMELTPKFPKLDSTPLMDVNHGETELFQNCHALKLEFENDVPSKKRFKYPKILPVRAPNKEVTYFENTTKKQCKSFAPSFIDTKLHNFTSTDHYSKTCESLNVSSSGASDHHTVSQNHQCSISRISSPEENEFIENEKRCESVNYKSNSNLELMSQATKHNSTNQGNTSKKIGAVLQNSQDCLKKLQLKFTNLQEKCNTFCNEFQEEITLLQGDIQNYQECYAQDIIKVIKLLENGKENLVTDREWCISTEPTGNVTFSENMSTAKKNVTFKLKSEDRIVEHFSLAENHLEKSVTLYNSIRKGSKYFLTTPKLDKICLQTPKSLRKDQRDFVSRRVQKQCLLLMDTPVIKNKKLS